MLRDEGIPRRAGPESIGAAGEEVTDPDGIASRPRALEAFYAARRAMIAAFLPLKTVLAPAELEEEAVGTGGQILGIALLTTGGRDA